MKTLCLDSAHKYLVIGLYENDRMICGTANLSWKRQSETIFPELMRLMKEAGWDSDDVDEVVKQLNEKKENLGFIKAITDTSAYIKGINDAIEIVKERGQNKSHPKPRYIY